MTTSKVFKNWLPGGVVQGVLKESGIFDDSPLYHLLIEKVGSLGGQAVRRLVLACADVKTGRYTTFDEKMDDLPRAAVSSASIPAAFPNQQWPDYGDGVICMDGGTVWNINVASAVQRCREVVKDDRKIVIDIIMCDSQQTLDWKPTRSVVDTIQQYKKIHSYATSSNNLAEIMQAFPKVDWRYLVAPSEDLPGSFIGFENKTVTWPC